MWPSSSKRIHGEKNRKIQKGEEKKGSGEKSKIETVVENKSPRTMMGSNGHQHLTSLVSATSLGPSIFFLEDLKQIPDITSSYFGL